MKRKIFSLALAIVLACTMLMPAADFVSAASSEPRIITEDGMYTGSKMWQNGDEENYQVILHTFVPNEDPEDITEITIPSEIDGHPVVGLRSNKRWSEDGFGMFEDMVNLKEVTIPSTVTQIWSSVFQGCTSLTTINGFQNDAEYDIGKEAFYGTPWYADLEEKGKNTGVIIGTTVIDLSSCSGDVVIPEGITKVVEDAITIYDPKEDDDLWEPNHNITSLHIPKTLREFAVYNTLVDGNKLKAFTVASGNVSGFYAEDGVLFKKETVDGETQVTLQAYPKMKTDTAYTVPAEVYNLSFIRGQSLKKLSFAGDYVMMASKAFENCKNLTTVNLPKTTIMGPHTFDGTKVTSITIPAGFQDITNSAGSPFTGATTVKTIKVASGCKNYKVVNGALLKKDSEGKFTKLIAYPAAKSGTTLTVPDGVKEVYTLEESKNLKTIVLPKSLEWVAISTPTDTLGNIKTIKYKGSKDQWENVYFGGYYTYDSDVFKAQFNTYYNAKSISSAKVSGIKSSYAYTGKAIKPTATVKLNGTKLKKDSAYTVAYKNNTKTGKATITISEKTNSKYYGTVTKTFNIVPKQIASVKTKALGSKKISVSWKKNTTASGYEIQYSKNKSFKNASKVSATKNSTVSKTITKLSKGKTYYVRVRAYKTIDGKRAYGAYSKTTTVKVK